MAAGIFLAVSLASLVVQAAAFIRLAGLTVEGGVARALHGGLLRTSACRVLAAAAYVSLGVAALAEAATAVVTLLVFVFVQVMWQVNALADVRLKRRTQAVE